MNKKFEKPEEAKVLEVERSEIEKVESLPIRDFDKVDLILLLSGLKTGIIPKSTGLI